MDTSDGRCLVGVISDTHGLLDPRVLRLFGGVAHIIHAGDIGGPEILRGLEGVAPVTAVRGNTDTAPWAWDLPETVVVELGGHRLLVGHIEEQLLRTHDPVSEGMSAVITGHSHSPAVVHRDGVLHLNPGAAGRRRFHLPKAVALLTVPGLGVGGLSGQHLELEAEVVILEPGGAAAT